MKNVNLSCEKLWYFSITQSQKKAGTISEYQPYNCPAALSKSAEFSYTKVQDVVTNSTVEKQCKQSHIATNNWEGGIMNLDQFIGKSVELKDHEADIYAPGESDREFTVAEVFLWDFECDGTDSEGRNAYSIQLYLDEQDRIVRIQRVGHCHMCGGQGSDDSLEVFPHPTLEEEAYQIITKLVV
ncbi:hypothetical protein ACFL3F_03635 [Planctomycetota bacterium]